MEASKTPHSPLEPLIERDRERWREGTGGQGRWWRGCQRVAGWLSWSLGGKKGFRGAAATEQG